MAKENATREEIRKRILELEKQKKFDVHVDPIDYSIALPVDSSFHYFPKGFKDKFHNFCIMNFGLRQFMRKVTHKWLELEVIGEENLKGIDSAVVISNHVQMFDCIALKAALRPHYTHIVAASFNNMKGPMGDSMRTAGMMPLPNDFHDMRVFDEAIKKALAMKRYVLIYPEQSEWWYYEKPRPFKPGAFYYAAKNDVPVIPCFITYKPRKKPDTTHEGMYPYGMIVHILPPIYPKAELDAIANRDFLKDAAFESCKRCYEETYKKKLTYDE